MGTSSHDHHHSQNKIITRFWIFLFASSVACCFLLYFYNLRVHDERKANASKVELARLGYQLGQYSDLLTMEARAFTVTSDLKHLFHYWNEIYNQKNREKIIETLKKFKVAEKESYLLIESKRNSDALVQSEIRAMKLILIAQKIPKELHPAAVLDFHLLPSDQALSPEKKILMAQKILFDEAYATNKANIVNPIKEFNENISRSIAQTVINAEKKSDRLFFYLILLFCLNSLLIIGIVWTRSRLSEPNNKK